MALRVLLADESSTIKKVFQLALQDFAVEVRPVNIGVDVLPVAKSFQPDIIFADVLLQKKSGYDVASELKSDGAMARIPIVLMWSGFMELDEDKFQACQANGKLEKPFDVTQLRKLVTDLVPKTQGQRISQFLKFPAMPDMSEEPPAPAAAAKPEEDFEQVSIPKMKSNADKFRIQLTEDEDAGIPANLALPDEPIDVDNIFREADEPEEFTLMNTKAGQPKSRTAPPPAPKPEPRKETARIETTQIDPMDLGAGYEAPMRPAATPPPRVQAPPPAPRQPVAPAPTVPQVHLTEADIEKIVRKQTQEMVESIIWKVVPELAQQIIEREIQKLLKEKDSSP